ncbi:YkgJ family cysteine cluster protein [Neptunicoccus cionae]|uniref:YkgJ family cysteine cluster protein n=1 Tax=Neptunicoccus cionae TaxID=2035344 RepID=A0A916QZC8_9RHOB|nr:YkgJ family cysteine cluster protein [Amylibacter cionae]GGA23465.1 hypothetical protein GCM10011498_25440 [Amylibacter cionae]
MAEVEIWDEDLCKACGACCDGSLFVQAKLADGEGILPDMEESFARNQRGFALPCPYFCETCTVYDIRPKICRTFGCELLAAVKDGAVPYTQALQAVGRLRTARAALATHLPDAANSVPTAEQRFAAGYRNYPDLAAFQADNAQTIAAIKEMQDATRPFTHGKNSATTM